MKKSVHFVGFFLHMKMNYPKTGQYQLEASCPHQIHADSRERTVCLLMNQT